MCVPSISAVEWHPFSVSSPPHVTRVTHHIRVMGDTQWTGRLHALAKSSATTTTSTTTSSSASAAAAHSRPVYEDDDGYHHIVTPLTVLVDGPYVDPPFPKQF